MSSNRQRDIVNTYQRWDFDTDGTAEDMAKQLGVSKGTIYRTLREHGLSPRKRLSSAPEDVSVTDVLESKLTQIESEIEHFKSCIAIGERQAREIHVALDALKKAMVG